MAAFDKYFNRHVKLTIYCEKDGETVIIPLENYQPENKNIRIYFEINYYPDQSGKTSPIYLKIYNLSEQNNDLICDNETDVSIRLEAGYGEESNLNTIFEGEINTKFANFEGNDVITNMWGFSFDGTLPKFNTTFTLPPKGNSLYSWEDILNTYTQEKGLSVIYKEKENYLSGLVNKTFKSKTFENLTELLDSMSKALNLKYAVMKQNDTDTIIFSPIKKGINSISSETKVLSRETGLLSNPNVTGAGLEIKTLLNPSLRPFDSVLIKSEYAKLNVGSSANFTSVMKSIYAKFEDSSYKNFYSNTYIVYLSHFGDTFADLWETRMRTLISNEEM